jgi:Uma2 family endonuclease
MPSTALLANEEPRPIRRVEYDKMVELGLFEGERVELLYGVIVRKSPKGPPHESAIERVTELLVRGLAGRATVRVQSAFAASDGSEPEPDVAVVPRADYSARHPSVAHLVIEVADSSLPTDRGTKATLYAECGVPEYWVVNVRDGILEVFTDIVRGAYTRVIPYQRGDTVSPLAFPDVRVAVSEILSGAPAT